MAQTRWLPPKPKSAEMIPGPGFRVKSEIERPDRALLDMYRAFETTDISDMLNRMYTMSSDIHNLVNANQLIGPAVTVKLFSRRQHDGAQGAGCGAAG